MTRIIAGVAKGRVLAVPPGTSTRPTSDRAREALFSTLQAAPALAPNGIEHARFLDLYAGSGAVGLEALSRGVAAAVFVEDNPAALRIVKRNIDSLDLPGTAVLPGTVGSRLSVGPGQLGSSVGADPFDVVFLDPPYAMPVDQVQANVSDLLTHGWLRPRAVIVVERASRDAAWHWPAGIQAWQTRRYGEAQFWYGQREN